MKLSPGAVVCEEKSELIGDITIGIHFCNVLYVLHFEQVCIPIMLFVPSSLDMVYVGINAIILHFYCVVYCKIIFLILNQVHGLLYTRKLRLLLKQARS